MDKPGPEPDDAPAQAKRRKGRHGKADEPVADQVGQHGGARVAQPAQRAGCHALQAIEQLERRRDAQQRDARRDDGGIRRVETDEEPGHRKKRDCRHRHEAAAESDGGPARARRGRRVSTSDRVADAHRSGRREAVRHHERDAGDVERYLMRGERHWIDTASERGHGPEDANLRRDLHRSGRTQSEQPHDPRPLDLEERDVRQAEPLTPFVQDDDDEQRDRHEDAGDDRRPGRAGDAHRREPVAPEDQDPVAAGVHDVRQQQRDHHRSHDPERLQVSPERRVEQQRQRAPRQDGDVGARQAHHRRVQAECRHRLEHAEGHQHQGRRREQRQVHAVAQPAMALVQLTGAERLRHERVEAEKQAHAEDSGVKNRMLPSPTAPMASGASQPTMSVSTTPMNIQPSSATMTGQASDSVAASSAPVPAWCLVAGMIL
jgi:hypothetical protein